jgi:hypothetical protein
MEKSIPPNLDQNLGLECTTCAVQEAPVWVVRKNQLQKQIKMKTLILAISGIMALFGSFQIQNNSNQPVAVTQVVHATAAVAACEEEPILLRGHVGNIAGNPISGASVVLKKLGEPLPSYATQTNSDGHYTIAGIDAGTYKLVISASGYQTKVVTIEITNDLERFDTLIVQ